jgi:hypothetical protein
MGELCLLTKLLPELIEETIAMRAKTKASEAKDY